MAAKSSSFAALLLMAAVLVGTCTSPAHAAGPGQVDLVNLCSYDAVLFVGNAVTGIVVNATKSLPIDLSFLQGIFAPVFIHINGQVYVLQLDALRQILGTTGVVVKINIVCAGVCGPNIITIQPYVQLFLNGTPIGQPTATTVVCADLQVDP